MYVSTGNSQTEKIALHAARTDAESRYPEESMDALRSDGKIVFNSSKAFVTSAGHTDGYVVITRSRESDVPTETTIYYVPASDPGIRVSGTWDALGMRGNASAPIVFKDVELLPDYALSSPGKGMDMLLETLLPIVNLGVASICMGISLSATEITKQHILNSELRHLKLTFALEIVAEKEVTYISADDIAYELDPENPEKVRIRAGKEFFRRLESAIQDEENILIEFYPFRKNTRSDSKAMQKQA